MKVKIMFALTMVAGLAISGMSMATSLPVPNIDVRAGNPSIPNGTKIQALTVGRGCNCLTGGSSGTTTAGFAGITLDLKGCHPSLTDCEVKARCQYTDPKTKVEYTCEGTGPISGSAPTYSSTVLMTCTKL